MYMLAVFVLSCAFGVGADVYKCERTDGSVYYQGKNCPEDRQTKLLTEVGAVPRETIERLQVDSENSAKQQKRKQKSKRKKSAKKKKELARKQKLCAKAKQEVAKIQAEYRHGYTAKRGQILDKRLADYKEKKLEYCS